jgi:hypothetical protein
LGPWQWPTSTTRRKDRDDNVDGEEVQAQVVNAVVVLESESQVWQLSQSFSSIIMNILVAAEPVAGEKEDTHDDTRKRCQLASTSPRRVAAAIAISIVVSAIVAAVLASTASKQPPTATTSHSLVIPAPQMSTQQSYSFNHIIIGADGTPGCVLFVAFEQLDVNLH